MFPALDEDLHFGYQLTGSLVVASSAEDEAFLEELYQRGLTNGVQNLRIVRGAELRQIEPNLDPISPSPSHLPTSPYISLYPPLRQIEPNLDPSATAALLSPDAGTLQP